MLISWSSWGKTIKNLIDETFLPLFLFLNLGLFWFFRPFGGKLEVWVALFIFVSALYWYLKKQKESLEFLVFLNLFLALFALQNLQASFVFAYWILELVFLLLFLFLFLYLLAKTVQEGDKIVFALVLLISLFEATVVLSRLPLNPLAKSFILTALFYLFWFVVIKKAPALSYGLTVAITILLVLLTLFL